MFKLCQMRADDYASPDVFPVVQSCLVQDADERAVRLVLSEQQRALLAALRVKATPVTAR